MEIINKLYNQNLQQANEILLNSLRQRQTNPFMGVLRHSSSETPSLPLSAAHIWQNMMSSNPASSIWLNQHLRAAEMLPYLHNTTQLGANKLFQENLQKNEVKSSQMSPASKLAFSIDNIINGNFEKSRPQPLHRQSTDVLIPSSPTQSTISDNGMKYECEVCGKTYSTFSGFTKHKQFYCTAQSTTKKQFNCKHCEKVYYSLGALKMHIRTHTLPCKCKVCGKAFSRPWLLQGHMRTHTGEKPFKCQHCGRAFADRSNLRAHLQTHSEVKKYSCKMCDKTFSRMSLLQKHEESSCLPGTSSGITTLF